LGIASLCHDGLVGEINPRLHVQLRFLLPFALVAVEKWYPWNIVKNPSDFPLHGAWAQADFFNQHRFNL
jgi:hypothetical protein